MAFNPIRRMNKHKKAIMAAMVLVSMITFVLMGSNFGGGDFFSALARILTGRARATDIASLYGKEISVNQLRLLGRQRQIANNFMIMATAAAAENRRNQIRKTLGTNPQAAQALEIRCREDPTYMELQQRYMMAAMFGQPYFVGGTDTQGLLDFLIWKHEADRLGIRLTRDDVWREITRLTLSSGDTRLFTKGDANRVEQQLRRTPEFKNFWNEDILLNALTDEFRVRMARNAMIGYEPTGIDRVPAPVTPAEFWHFYKDNRTTVEVGLLPVRVEDLLAQVKQKPTEAELKALYDKFKERGYNPESPEPGFKGPHRIQLEWVSAGLGSPYFKQLAADAVPLIETLQQVLAAGSPLVPLAGPTAVSTNVIQARTFDDQLTRKYNELKYRYYRNASLTGTWYDPYPMHKSSFQQPKDIAAMLGQSLGLAGTPAAPLSALTAAEGLATRREIRMRALFDVALAVFSGPQPLPLAGAALAAYGTPKDDYIPLAEVRDEVLEKMSADQAREVRNYVIEQVKKEIDKLAKKDKKAIAKYLAEAIQKYRLQTGKTTELRDRHRDPIADDPGLALFKEAYLRPPSEDPTGKKFAELFFPPPSRFNERPWETYSVKQWPDSFMARSADTVFLYWKTEDQPSKVVPLSDPEVRKQVEHAWRFQKARELAKKEAEQLAKQARAEKGDRRKLKDLAERLKKPLIELMPLAQLNPQPTISPDSAFQYNEPRIPEDRVPHVQGRPGSGRPSPFAERIVSLRDKPKGDTLVLPDQPENVYYVVVLIEKREPSPADFYRIYQDSASLAKKKDPLLARFERERQEKYIQEFMARLRRDADLKIHGLAARQLADQSGGE